MKRFFRTAVAVILALLVMTVMPAQVFADSLPEYIGEVKVYIGDCSAAANEGFTVLSDDSGNPVDLNKKAGGGLGSKGDKSVYLGYKTTTDRSEAITDLALMNMKGGYSVEDYDALMETYIKSQITPFVDNFLAAIKEYRENYNSGYAANKERAQYVHDMLNKLTDDDCGGAGLGDLLLNETKYEMGDTAYNALSDEQKKEHADILTIIAQANGNATLVLENLITRAADTNEDTWLDRFEGITYDDLVDATGMTPTDAEKELAKLYDDDANLILGVWGAFAELLASYDSLVEEIESYDNSEFEAAAEALNNLSDDMSPDEKAEIINDFTDAQNAYFDMMEKAEITSVHDYLEEISYGDGTMLDYFMTDADEIADDITFLYPLVASLSAGQRAGLEFVSIEELCAIALTDNEQYNTEVLSSTETASIYDGVDRAIYEKGGVALTSDAMRANVAAATEESRSRISGLTIASWAVTGACLAASVGSFIALGKANALVAQREAEDVILLGLYKENGMISNLEKRLGDLTTADVRAMNPEANRLFTRATANAKLCKSLAVGFAVVFVVITAVSLYFTWQDMKAYYKVDFTPIPLYMVDEKDIVAYNAKGEKVVIKNQSAYYKAAESNLKDGDFKFDEIGALADMNGCVGKQWLALYVNKNEALEPIIASSLIAVVDSSAVPAGYSTGIHMFGSSAAFNLNSSLYDWNDSAPSVFVYYQTDDSAVSTTGTNFTGGTLALTGGAGLAIGALATALAMKPKKKKEASEKA